MRGCRGGKPRTQSAFKLIVQKGFKREIFPFAQWTLKKSVLGYVLVKYVQKR